jgi:hypothetical protein
MAERADNQEQGPSLAATARMVGLLRAFEKNAEVQIPTVVFNDKQCFRQEHESIGRFVDLVYEDDWIVGFDWSSWDEGREIAADLTRVANAGMMTIRKLITALVRNERFCEGALQDAYERGLLMAILRRIEALRGEDDDAIS